MSLKVADVDRAFGKLQMEIRESGDKLAFFVYKGKRILSTRRSHGKGKIEGNIPHKIRTQLKLNESEFRELVQCPLDYDGYVAILKKRKIISGEDPA
ncbi:MAG: hypothetical protein HY713_05760 [candidate division NC10 bacterium]|nr:hypothetical protein [candidate division NC10 bacterium]